MDLQRYAHCYVNSLRAGRRMQGSAATGPVGYFNHPVWAQWCRGRATEDTTNNKVSPRWLVEQNYVFYLSTRILSFSDDGVWLWLLGSVWNGYHLFAVLHKGLTMGREGTSQRFKSAIGWHERTKRRKKRWMGGGWRQRVHGNGSFSPPPPSSSGISPMLWR